ncbi:MAG: hypothetical protein R3F56_19260 [Planctomycetota bacterium]
MLPLFRLVAALAASACVGLGLRATVQNFWTCDDAFISFRYAENFLNGHGLVFNVGERVEGYTNFAWTMLVAAGMHFGVEPETFTHWAGFACFATTVGLLLAASRRASGGAAWMPIAAMGLALNTHAQLFATCGLETSLFVLLATMLLFLTAWGRSALAFAAAGAVGTLAAMTRPDGLVLCAVAGTYALIRAARGRLPWSRVLAMALPGVLVYVPYFVWKWGYYGYPLPNTFYAKTAHDPYLSQGLLYLRLFFSCYWALALALGALVLATFLRRPPDLGEPATDALPQLTFAFVSCYLAFVAWVGGDFMFGRFVMPVTPLLYLSFELLRRRWPAPGLALALAALAVAGTVLRRFPEQLRDRGEINGIVEEPTYYPADEVAHKKRCAERLRQLYGNHPSRLAIGGAQAMIAYYGKFDLVIECSTGLTDAHLAHLPVGARTRIGHEKNVMDLDPDYVLRRRVQLWIDTKTPDPPANDHHNIDFGDFWGHIVTWDRELMRHLHGQPGVAFVDCEALLDRFIPKLPTMPDADVDRLWQDLWPLYFEPNDDAVREAAFRTRLGLPPRQ